MRALNKITRVQLLLAALALVSLGFHATAKVRVAKKSSTKVQAAKKTKAVKTATAVVPSARPSIFNTPIRKPANLDPNGAVEVRGQARTLSMMLVLKNGKDEINFIKVRKNYHPEIMNTDF